MFIHFRAGLVFAEHSRPHEILEGKAGRAARRKKLQGAHDFRIIDNPGFMLLLLEVNPPRLFCAYSGEYLVPAQPSGMSREPMMRRL